jgi:hypothetical protein
VCRKVGQVLRRQSGRAMTVADTRVATRDDNTRRRAAMNLAPMNRLRLEEFINSIVKLSHALRSA